MNSERRDTRSSENLHDDVGTDPRGSVGHDFWQSSGYSLLCRDDTGRVVLTPEYFAAYWRLPEVRPSEESCAKELALSDALLRDPLRPVGSAELAGLADRDMQENYRAVLRFRDFLTAVSSLVEAYLRIATGRGRVIDFPPVFVDHLVHVLLRSQLDGCRDAFCARAAEIFFRPQQVSLGEGTVLLADCALVEGQGKLAGEKMELDLLSERTVESYWRRSDRFDFALDIAHPKPGIDGLARAMEAWLRGMLGLEVRIQSVSRIDDQHWRWHIGLDREATSILNALYRGGDHSESDSHRILALFRMDIVDHSRVTEDMAGRPIWLGLAMDDRRVLRMKPQNLLSNLPLRMWN